MRASDSRASASSGSFLPSSSSARVSSFSTASASSDLNTSTRARDSIGAISSNDGFSVVAPTSTMVPSSITGRKLSCWARLKRWISSTNSSVPCPISRRARASSNTFFRSATPEKIALICTNSQAGLVGEQPRHRGLAGAGRAPEDQRAERVALQHAGQRAVGTEQMVLADHVGELLRAELVGERPRRVGIEPRRREQARARAAFGAGGHRARPHASARSVPQMRDPC